MPCEWWEVRIVHTVSFNWKAFLSKSLWQQHQSHLDAVLEENMCIYLFFVYLHWSFIRIFSGFPYTSKFSNGVQRLFDFWNAFQGASKKMGIRSPLTSVLQCMLLVLEQFKVWSTALLEVCIGINCFCLALQVSSYLVWRIFNKIVNTHQIHYELKSSIWSKAVLWTWFWTFHFAHIISVGFLLGMSKSCNWNVAFNKQTRSSALLSLWCVEHCAQLPSWAPLRMLSLSEAQGLSVQRQAKFIKISYKTTVWWSILLHCGWF